MQGYIHDKNKYHARKWILRPLEGISVSVPILNMIHATYAAFKISSSRESQAWTLNKITPCNLTLIIASFFFNFQNKNQKDNLCHLMTSISKYPSMSNPLLIVSCPLLRKNVVGDRGHTYSQTNTQTENTSSKLFRCNINYATKQV